MTDLTPTLAQELALHMMQDQALLHPEWTGLHPRDQIKCLDWARTMGKHHWADWHLAHAPQALGDTHDWNWFHKYPDPNVLMQSIMTAPDPIVPFLVLWNKMGLKLRGEHELSVHIQSLLHGTWTHPYAQELLKRDYNEDVRTTGNSISISRVVHDFLDMTKWTPFDPLFVHTLMTYALDKTKNTSERLLTASTCLDALRAVMGRTGVTQELLEVFTQIYDIAHAPGHEGRDYLKGKIAECCELVAMVKARQDHTAIDQAVEHDQPAKKPKVM